MVVKAVNSADVQLVLTRIRDTWSINKNARKGIYEKSLKLHWRKPWLFKMVVRHYVSI